MRVNLKLIGIKTSRLNAAPNASLPRALEIGGDFLIDCQAVISSSAGVALIVPVTRLQVVIRVTKEIDYSKY
jgi:hypothetical protein